MLNRIFQYRFLIRTTRFEIRNLATNSDEMAEFNESLENIPEVEEFKEKEENFKKLMELKRYVGRFPTYTSEMKYKNEIKNFKDLNERCLHNKKYFRKIYAFHGKESGVEAGILWPSKAELEEILNFEREYDLKFREKIERFYKQKRQKIDEFKSSYKKIDDAAKAQPKQIEEYFQRFIKKEEASNQKMKKTQEILDKAREYYGYDLGFRDERIQRMIAQADEDKKKEKKEKKLTDSKSAKAAVKSSKAEDKTKDKNDEDD